METGGKPIRTRPYISPVILHTKQNRHGGVKLKSPPTVKDAELFWHLGVNATTFESNGADLIEQILPGADGPDWNTSWGRGEILQPDARVYAQLESLRRQAAQIIIAAASMKTDDAFSCHRAIVVGLNETATDQRVGPAGLEGTCSV
jgi:hypothetical protein